MHHHMAKWHKEHNYQPTLYGIDDLLNDMFGRMTDFRRERSFDSYEETVRLPVKVKGAETKAKCADGVLTVTLPREDAVKPASHIVNVQ